MEEVLVEVEVAVGTRSKDIRCEIKPRELEVTVHQRPVIKVYSAVDGIRVKPQIRIVSVFTFIVSVATGGAVRLGSPRRVCLDTGSVSLGNEEWSPCVLHTTIYSPLSLPPPRPLPPSFVQRTASCCTFCWSSLIAQLPTAGAPSSAERRSRPCSLTRWLKN